MKPIEWNFFLILSIICLSACSDSGKQTDGATTASVDTTVAAPSEPSSINGSSCYQYISGKDSVQLHLEMAGSNITGYLTYHYFEKDQNTGTINGQMKGDTLLATYTFVSEGNESEREVAFLRRGEGWVEGYGEIKQVNGKAVFVNTSSLDFTSAKPLQKTDCRDDLSLPK